MRDQLTMFPVGQVRHVPPVIGRPALRSSEIRIRYPLRLNAMAIDPSQIEPRADGIYTPGEVAFATRLFLDVSVCASTDSETVVVGIDPSRAEIAVHAAEIMRKVVGLSGGFVVEVHGQCAPRHAGLGSSGALLSAVAYAINEMYGRPIDLRLLVQFLAQNHGEEVDGTPGMLYPVQCIGGSAAAGIIGGGVLVIAGESTVIGTGCIGEEYSVVLGIPKEYTGADSAEMMSRELDHMDGFVEAGLRYRHAVAYDVLHLMLPALVRGDVGVMGDVIWDYRYSKGSIHNCSFCCPRILDIAEDVKYLKEQSIAQVLSISSVGPLFFAITKQARPCIDAFESCDMQVMVTGIHNNGAVVVASQDLEVAQ